MLTLSIATSLSAGLWDSFKSKLPALTAKNVFLGACVTYTACSLGRRLFNVLSSYLTPRETAPTAPADNFLQGLYDIEDTPGQTERFTIPNPNQSQCILSQRRAGGRLNIFDLTTNNQTYTIYEHRLRERTVIYITNEYNQCSPLYESDPLVRLIRAS